MHQAIIISVCNVCVWYTQTAGNAVQGTQ